MIPWDGEEMQERPDSERCWRTVNGDECGEPATTAVGLCGLCLATMQEAPVMVIPAPPSEAFMTGAGRRHRLAAS